MELEVLFNMTGPPKVAEGTFIGVHWGGVVISAIFFAFRIYVRVETFHRVYPDDLLIFAAWLMLLTSAVIWQINKDKMYQGLAMTSGQLAITPDALHEVTKYLRASTAVMIFFYSCLWSVKISFLIFFRRLGHNVRGQKHLWWFVMAVTLVSYFGSLSLVPYKCLAALDPSTPVDCVTPESTQLLRHQLLSAVVIDVVTDALIIMVPVTMLWKVKISLRQKMGLIGIFSITIIVIAFAIARVALVITYSQIPDESWLYMWSAIEQTVAITVACLGSYRALFVKQDRSRRLTDSEESGNPGSLHKIRRNSKGGGQTLGLRNLDSQTSTFIHSRNESSREHKSQSVDSQELFIPPNRVLVKKTIHTVITEDRGSNDLNHLNGY